ncbi:hypothetical protein MTR_1g052795 [Medicago truncatula]|uniref:Uncharacterized protein n=1 Tax=Medicago truncatula TaxID=3880 RepID=A0A072VJ18_MEDTR|nr:hypothetical protein MTR_1g052795 [Medicago truncatula]
MPPKFSPPRLPPKIRKFESGAEKRRKKKKIAELIESQTGALDKFILKEIQIPIVYEPSLRILKDGPVTNGTLPCGLKRDALILQQ